MNKHYPILALLLVCLIFLACNNGNKINGEETDKIVLAYVTSWSDVIPNPTYLTHINYAFGKVDSTFDRITVDNPDRLKSIVKLKEQKPNLKILLSVGGWGAGNFSEMATNDSLRMAFAMDCKRVMNEFGLDGVDIDWEYPTNEGGGISHSDADTDNFTLLMRDMRQAMGDNALITFATPTPGKYYDYKACLPYVDFINLMGYDINYPPYHHAGLYRSEHTDAISIEESVLIHLELGIPRDKLVLGVPFYGRVKKDYPFGSAKYRDIANYAGELTKEWDDVAKAPYFANQDGEMIVTYEDTKSIAAKCEFIHQKNLLGAMYWEYSGDTDDQDLLRALYNGVFKK